MKDVKLGLRLLKFGYGVKGMGVCAVAVFLLSIPLCAVSMLKAINVPAGYFLLLAVFIPSQGMISLYASDLVMASPVRKRLEVSIFVMMQFVGSVAAYLLLLAMGGVVAARSPELIGHVSNQLLQTAVSALCIELYAGACRKYMVASTVGFAMLLLFSRTFFPVELLLPVLGSGWELFAKAALLGLALVLFGGGLMYLCNRALYRAPMSKLCQTAGLRKTL